jgi:hypothetical protein
VNLIAAAMAFGLWQLLSQPASLLGVMLVCTVVTGLLLGVVNLLPFRAEGWSSDGHTLWQLLRNSSAWRVSQAQQMSVAAAVAGVRPRDWPGAMDDVPEDVPVQLRMAGHSLRLSAALDGADMRVAADAALGLAETWPQLSDGQRQLAAINMATYAARTHKAALLAAWRPLCDGGMMDLSPYRLWLDAETAAMAGDAEKARALVVEARAALPRVHDRSSQAVLAGYLDELEGRP